MDDGTMNLDQRRFGRLVSRHALLILIAVIVGAGVGLGLTFAKPVNYAATTQLRVANPLTLTDILGTSNNTNTTVVTVADQIAVLGSDSVKAQVESRIGQSSGANASFSSPSTGQVVTIRATAKTRDLASKVASAYTQTYLDNLAVRNTPLFNSAIAQLNDTIKSIDSQVAVLQSALKTANSSTLQQIEAEISPQVQQLEARRTDVSRQLNSVQLARVVTPSGNASVVSAPTTSKNGSGITTTLIGAVVGLLLGLLLAGIREARYGRVVDLADVERYGLPVIASVPAPLPRRIRTAVQALAAGRDAAAYREAAVLLAPPHAADVAKRWLVTSADRDGVAGAVLAGRLARRVAQMGRRVVLVDCAAGLRGRNAGATGQPGISEVLRGEVPITHALQLDVNSNVAVLGPGNGFANLPEPLASSAFAGLLDSLADRFDIILITGAPFEQSADAYVLAPLVNLIVVALHSGVTRRKSIEQASARLASVVGDARVEAILVGARKGGFARGGGPEDGVRVIEEPQRQPATPKRSMSVNRVPLHGSAT